LTISLRATPRCEAAASMCRPVGCAPAGARARPRRPGGGKWRIRSWRSSWRVSIGRAPGVPTRRSAPPPPAALAAIDHLVPTARPLLAPGERPAADGASFGGEVGFLGGGHG
jgi:hypothetical protein